MILKSKQFGRFIKSSRGKILLSLIIVSLLLISTIAVFAFANAPHEVTILDGTKHISIMTNSDDPEEILASQGILLGENDVLDQSQFNMDNSVLLIKREMKIKLDDGNSAVEKTVVARTVKDVLSYLCLGVEKNDVVEPSLNTVVADGDTVKYIKAGTAQLYVDDKTTTVITSDKTVSEILEENNVSLSSDDEVSPDLDTVVKDGGKIVVSRVTYKQESETVKLKYKTVTKTDSSMAEGKTVVQTAGADGEKQLVYQIKYVNGKTTGEKKLTNEKIIKEAVNRVVIKGTAKAVSVNSSKTAGTTASGLKYSAKYTGIASAYTAPSGAVTASGLKAGVGRVGVNPNIIPYGTKLYITGYGYAVAADTGWGVNGGGRLVDVFFNTENECVQWGLKNVTVYVLK